MKGRSVGICRTTGPAAQGPPRFALRLGCAPLTHNSTLTSRKVFFQGTCPWKNDWIVFAACGRQTPAEGFFDSLKRARNFLPCPFLCLFFGWRHSLACYFASSFSRCADLIAFISATPKTGAKTMAITPLVTVAGSLETISAQHWTGSVKWFSNIPL